MDRVHIRQLRGRDNPRDIEVRLLRRPRPDTDGPIRKPQVRRGLVRPRVHAHRLHPQLAARANDPECNLPAIGNKDAAKHQPGRTRKSFCPNSTASPLLTNTLSTVPVSSAFMSLNTFIASIKQTVVSGVIEAP